MACAWIDFAMKTSILNTGEHSHIAHIQYGLILRKIRVLNQPLTSHIENPMFKLQFG